MGEPSALDALARMIPALAVIIGGLLLVRRWSQRGGVRVDSGIRVLARTGVSRGAIVAVVQVGARRFFVGAGEHGVTLLSELEPDASVVPGLDLGEGTMPVPANASPNAAKDLAHASGRFSLRPAQAPSAQRPAFPADRPWMGPIRRLQAMTVRTHLHKADLHAPRT